MRRTISRQPLPPLTPFLLIYTRAKFPFAFTFLLGLKSLNELPQIFRVFHFIFGPLFNEVGIFFAEFDAFFRVLEKVFELLLGVFDAGLSHRQKHFWPVSSVILLLEVYFLGVFFSKVFLVIFIQCSLFGSFRKLFLSNVWFLCRFFISPGKKKKFDLIFHFSPTAILSSFFLFFL